jgi:hypothetical protein
VREACDGSRLGVGVGVAMRRWTSGGVVCLRDGVCWEQRAIEGAMSVMARLPGGSHAGLVKTDWVGSWSV